MDRKWQGLPSLSPVLAVDPGDPEAARARAAIESRLLGVPLAPARIGRFVVLERLGAGGMGIVYAAFDPRLDRKVAIKLLFEHGGESSERDRLVIEAKAMAKLAHPHVVHVYEVGEHRGRLFVAMEYVRGRTLRQWLAERTRGIRETLAMCVQAGQGLAAAHAAGIVHRDFKPDNVLVGDDGRARVLDFGLARSVYDHTAPDDCRSLEDIDLTTLRTRTGLLLGTPGYMAPEQLRGEPADRRSDQFSFCVTVWEALTGALPFVGRNVDELRESITRGRIQAPPRGKLSGRVERVLRRGLASEGRWATLDELLHALARDPRAAATRRVAAVAMVAGIAAAFAVGNAMHEPTAVADPCGGAEATMAEAWPVAQRDAAWARIASIGGEYGDALVPGLRADVDDFAARWSATHRDACTAHLRGEQSAELLDKRMTCLDRGRSALATLGRITSDVEPEGLPALAFAAGSLPEPEQCSDLARLGAAVEPLSPGGKVLAARVQELDVLHRAGRIDEAFAAIPRAVEDVRAVGHRALLAEALYLHAMLLIERTDRGSAAEPLREATALALASGADDIAILAWSNRAWAHGTGDHDEDPDALAGMELMKAFVERHLDSPAAVSFYSNLGGAHIGLGHRDVAREYFRRAVQIGERLAPGAARQRAQVTGNLALVTDDQAVRERLLDEAVRAWIDAAGAEHPRTISARLNQATLCEDPVVALELLTDACRDLRTLHPKATDDIAACEHETSILAEEVGDRSGALAAIERSLALAADNELERAKLRVAALRGDAEAAAAIAGVLLADYEGEQDLPFWQIANRGQVELELGRAWQAVDDPRADAMLGRALASFEAAARVQPTPATRRRVTIARRMITNEEEDR